MYEIFEKLCAENGVTPYRVCKETGITTTSTFMLTQMDTMKFIRKIALIFLLC